jgi:cytochrome c-type biogenesis protein CcmH
MKLLKRAGIGLCLLGAGSAAAVVFEEREFTDPALADRYRALTQELRCLVCQNQSLAESDADLAADLRARVHAMLEAGADDREITDYMVARYGDFVRYRPPLKASTVALWIGPFVLGAAGLAVLYRHVRRRAAAAPPPPLPASERRRLEDALHGDGEAGR